MSSEADRAAALLARARELDRAGRHDDEIAVYDEVVSRCGTSTEPDVVAHVLRARLYKAITLYDLDREEEALTVLDDLRARGEPGDGDLGDRVQWVFSRATKYEAYCLEAMERDAEALARYVEVEARFGDVVDPVVLFDVAAAVREKAALLWRLGREDEALDAAERMIRRFRDVEDEDVAEEVALASIARGRWLASRERHQEALQAYDLACGRPSLDADDRAEAEYLRGFELQALGRDDDAIVQFAGVARRFLHDEDSVARIYAARAANWQGVLLWRCGQREQAMAAQRPVAALPADDDVADLRAERSRALLALGHGLAREGRADEAILAYDEVLVTYADDEHLAADVDRALRGKLDALSHFPRNASETIVVADALGARAAASGGVASAEEALSAKGTALAAEGRFEEAIEAFEAAADAVADSDEPRLRCAAGLALVNKAAALAGLGRVDEAIALQKETAERFGSDMLDVIAERLAGLDREDSAWARVECARLRVRYAQTLATCGRLDEAICALDRLLDDTDGLDDDAQIAEMRSVARLTRERLFDPD